MNFSSVIQQWFKDEWGGSLVLPDGWYGKPYDNQHSLTSVDESEAGLTMVLDRILLLRFEGLKAVSPGNRELILGPFDRLHFEWEPFGGGKRQAKEYQGGEVKIVSAPG